MKQKKPTFLVKSILFDNIPPKDPFELLQEGVGYIFTGG
jgi:hypothetical protein